jgi:hypothetical protein
MKTQKQRHKPYYFNYKYSGSIIQSTPKKPHILITNMPMSDIYKYDIHHRNFSSKITGFPIPHLKTDQHEQDSDYYHYHNYKDINYPVF